VGHRFLQSSATSISTNFPRDIIILNESAGKNCGMSLIYTHWKTVVTVHMSISKMHEFSHFELKRLTKKSKRGKKTLVTYSGGKTTDKLLQMGKIRCALPRTLVSFDQLYRLQVSTTVPCTAGSHPEEPLCLLPFASLACGFPSS